MIKKGCGFIFTIFLFVYLPLIKAQEPCIFSDYLFNSISIEQGLSQSSVLCLIQDNYGFIWMGTKYGLNRYDGYRFVSYRYNPADSNSLQSNEIIQLKLDYHGDILIGTRGGGLSKYIYKTHSFVRIPAIPKNASVNAIYVDTDSTLWIGSTAGLFRGKEIPGTNRYHFENLSVHAIYKNAQGAIIPPTKQLISVVSVYKEGRHSFLTGMDKGICRFNLESQVFQQLDMQALNQAKVISILSDGQGKTYIGSSEGMALVDSSYSKQPTIRYYDAFQPAKRRLKVNWVNQILLDNNHTLWGATRGGGLFKLDKSGNIIQYFKAHPGKGYINDNVINALLIDNTGVLWIGTESRGCNTLDLNRKKFQHVEVTSFKSEQNQEHQVTAITGDKNHTIWVGTAFNGINKISFSSGGQLTAENFNNISVFSTMPTNEIISMKLDHAENLWVGMAINSIAKVDKHNSISSMPTAGFVFSIYEDQNHHLWYGTWGNGLGLIEQTAQTPLVFNSQSGTLKSLSNDVVLSITDDQKQNLWVGTKGGGVNVAPIQVLLTGQSGFVNYAVAENDSTSLSNNDVNCIFQDSRGTVWIGTSHGLNKTICPSGKDWNECIYQGKLKFASYYQSDGLPNNVVCGILEDTQGFLWISTMDGLSKLNPDNETFTNYNANDGLQGNEFHTNAYYKASDGRLFFGGVNGITVFNPAEIKQNPYLSQITITALKVFDTDVHPKQKILNRVILHQDITSTKKITLSHKQKEFTFEFSGMHFSNTANVRYKYRMLGFNEAWRLTGPNEHAATYTNLFEGDYTFQVKATNNDGIWSDKIAEIQITVLPPFWRTPLFYVIYFLSILVLLFFFRKYSLIAATEKTKLKLEALEKKKMMEVTESKMRFFTNISHEIRTPLTLIFSPLERVINQGKLDEESQSSLLLVKKNVSRLLSLTNQLLQLRKLDIGILEPQYESVNCKNYLNDILGYFENQIKRKNIQLHLQVVDISDDEVVWIDKEMITTTLYNLLSNAYKYSREHGNIHIKMSKVSLKDLGTQREMRKMKHLTHWLQIEIRDDGVGIPSKELNRIFHRFYQSSNSLAAGQTGSGIGLSIVKEYVELHQGLVKAASQLGNGTTMQVYLPLDKKHVSDKQIKKQLDHKRVFENLEPIVTVSEMPASSEKINDLAQSQPTRLLIVDDDLDMLNFLKSHFNQAYQVITATGGKEAWDLVQKELPELVISDVMMPDVDGMELCNRIKQQVETSHIPVILLTAKAGDDSMIEGYEKGADRYISKPFSLHVLDAQVVQLLATRKHLIDLYSRKILLKPRDITITSTDEKFLSRLMEIIEENLSDSDFDVTEVVDKMHMSHSAVLKKLKALTNTSLVEFVRRHRLNKAALIFQQDKLPVNEVAYMVGFSDPKYFSKCFSKQFGKTPSEYVAEYFQTKESERH